MSEQQPLAPWDHFSAHRVQLAQLAASMRALRQASLLGHRTAAGLQHGLISASAALLAYLPMQRLGLKEGFWSAITAISVTQSEFQATQSTARDQFLGAAIGGTIAVGAALVAPANLLLYAATVVLAMLSCWALNIASASRLAGVTATIVLLVPHTGSPERMFVSRLGEVGWGLCVAIVTVWLVVRLPLRHLRGADRTAGSDRRE